MNNFDEYYRGLYGLYLSLLLSLRVVDEATNPEAALNDALKAESKGKGGAGLVASSTTSNPKSKLELSTRP